jgi:hypothetical protein
MAFALNSGGGRQIACPFGGGDGLVCLSTD